ncbi:MAG TPA: Lrp/AsnC family transcriptional regulator [Candidatus Nanoarchaeia archaeon]|nr:Lrp/AsnC family transcriptional regulator [Candidatus Nanoarchaeia archaeon]
MRSRIRPTDIRILTYLRTHARASLTAIAHAAGLPISTVHDRLKVIHELLIRQQVTLPRFPRLGYHIHCFTALRVAAADRPVLQRYLEHCPNINNLFQINNGYDYLMETYFPQLTDFEKFLNVLSEKFRMKHVQAYYVIEQLQSEQFLSTPAHLAVLQVQV